MQTVTNLDLSSKDIGNIGVEHLASELQNNKVILMFCLIYI